MEKFCGRFSLPEKGKQFSRFIKYSVAQPNCVQRIMPKAFARVYGEKISILRGCEVIFIDKRVWSLPCSLVIHSFFAFTN